MLLNFLVDYILVKDKKVLDLYQKTTPEIDGYAEAGGFEASMRYIDSDETDRQTGMHACMKSNNSIFYTQHLL